MPEFATSPETLGLWRETLDAMAAGDPLRFLRARCGDRPVAAADLFARLDRERQALLGSLDAWETADADGQALGEQLAAFFVQVHATACRYVAIERDEALIWPYVVPEPLPAPPSERALDLLHDTSHRVLGELDLGRLLPMLAERAASLARADVAFLALWNPAAGVMELVAAHGLPVGTPGAIDLTPAALKALCPGARARMLGPGEAPWLDGLLDRVGARALVAPMLYQDEPLGLLGCAGPGLVDEAENAAALLGLLANHTTTAIRNAAHYREVMHKALALREANDQLRGLDRMKDEFVATVSHELRTPLNFITGFGSLLLDGECGEMTEEQSRFVQLMLDGAFQLRTLVNDLLDYSRLSAGHFTFHFAEGSPAAMLYETAEPFQLLAERKALALTLDFSEDLPAFEADWGRLGQVVTNLLANAVKFTPEGGRLTLRALQHGDRLRVSVEDTGIGIKPEHQRVLFERFRQVDASPTRRAGGTGLGLAISKSLIEAHGGVIGVDSPLQPDGTGSRFWFELPGGAATGQAPTAAPPPPLSL